MHGPSVNIGCVINYRPIIKPARSRFLRRASKINRNELDSLGARGDNKKKSKLEISIRDTWQRSPKCTLNGRHPFFSIAYKSASIASKLPSSIRQMNNRIGQKGSNLWKSMKLRVANYSSNSRNLSAYINLKVKGKIPGYTHSEALSREIFRKSCKCRRC